MLSIQSMVSQIEALPLSKQQGLAKAVYHAMDVKYVFLDKSPMPRTADLSTIDWTQIIATILADAPEILALIQEVLALTGG